MIRDLFLRLAPRKAIAAAISVGASLVLTVAAPPAASAAAWNNGVLYLHAPVPPNFGTACVERNIWLKQGAYRWKIYVAPKVRPDLAIAGTRHIELRAGSYRWRDCFGAPEGQYVQCSWLDELKNGIGGAASQCLWPPARIGDAYYNYGSGLDWESP